MAGWDSRCSPPPPPQGYRSSLAVSPSWPGPEKQGHLQPIPGVLETWVPMGPPTSPLCWQPELHAGPPPGWQSCYLGCLLLALWGQAGTESSQTTGSLSAVIQGSRSVGGSGWGQISFPQVLPIPSLFAPSCPFPLPPVHHRPQALCSVFIDLGETGGEPEATTQAGPPTVSEAQNSVQEGVPGASSASRGVVAVTGEDSTCGHAPPAPRQGQSLKGAPLPPECHVPHTSQTLHQRPAPGCGDGGEDGGGPWEENRGSVHSASASARGGGRERKKCTRRGTLRRHPGPHCAQLPVMALSCGWSPLGLDIGHLSDPHGARSPQPLLIPLSSTPPGTLDRPSLSSVLSALSPLPSEVHPA